MRSSFYCPMHNHFKLWLLWMKKVIKKRIKDFSSRGASALTSHDDCIPFEIKVIINKH